MQKPVAKIPDPVNSSPVRIMSASDESTELRPKFDDKGLMAAVAIDHVTREPLMLAWMNEEALAKTIELGEAVYFSRSRQELWHKGATSGHTQTVMEMRIDCDQDALVLYVEQKGAGACHTNRPSCFYRRIDRKKPQTLEFIE